MSSPASSAPDPKALPSASTLLAATLRFYRHNAGVILGYAGWLLVPLIATIALRVTLGMSDTAIVIGRIIDGMSIALSVWVYVHITQIAAQSTAKEHPSAPLGKHLLTVFFVLLLYYLLVIFGIALFVVPGIIFGVLFCYAAPAAILDRMGFVSAFVHSRDLVFRMFWKTLGRLLAMAAFVAVIYLGIAAVLALVYPQTLSADLATGLPLPVDITLSLGEIVLTPVTIIFVTMLYLARKNG